jgi:putative ABC transport system permease protein
MFISDNNNSWSKCDEKLSIICPTRHNYRNVQWLRGLVERQSTMKYSGIMRIGFKLLVNDKPKFSALLIGITFAVFLMMQMTAMFAGILNRAFSTVTNIGAEMWIMDPAVNTASSAIPMPDYVLDSVRSMDGVSYAVPLFMGGALVKLTNGTYQSVNVVGLDDSSLFGRPELEQGNIQDIYADNSFIVVNDAEFSKLGNPKIGTTFELNDHRGVIVGIARVAANGLNGVPTLYTTFNRAKEYLPTTRFTISYILVQPKTGAAVAEIKQQVAKLGYVAFTKDEFNKRISDYYTYQTGIGTNILLMTVIAFIVGLSISGQTFYTFILENLEKFGALKAIGAKGRELVYMILFMATFTALTGYGLGIGLVTLMISIAKYRLPNYAAMITFWNLGLAFGMVLLIAGISSYVGIRKVLKIEPFDIFRG